MKRAVFLDRDGVITQEPPHYAHKIDQLRLIRNTAKAIRLLNKAGFLVIVITNQAGIAKGCFKEEDTNTFNQEMQRRLNRKGARIDAIYYCPHHPEAVLKKYQYDCSHRKPQTGMLEKARDEYNIDLKRAYLVGDKISDIETGHKVGCKTILVKTGHGVKESMLGCVTYDYLTNNLYTAALLIKQNENL